MGLKDCPRGAHMCVCGGGGRLGRGAGSAVSTTGSPALKGRRPGSRDPRAEVGVADAVCLLLSTEHFKTPRILFLRVRTEGLSPRSQCCQPHRLRPQAMGHATQPGSTCIPRSSHAARSLWKTDTQTRKKGRWEEAHLKDLFCRRAKGGRAGRARWQNGL